MRADLASLDTDALKMIDGLRSWGLLIRAVVITRFAGRHAAKRFRARLEHRGIQVYYHYMTQGYPPTSIQSSVPRVTGRMSTSRPNGRSWS